MSIVSIDHLILLFDDARVNTKLGFDPSNLHALARIFALIV